MSRSEIVEKIYNLAYIKDQYMYAKSIHIDFDSIDDMDNDKLNEYYKNLLVQVNEADHQYIDKYDEIFKDELNKIDQKCIDIFNIKYYYLECDIRDNCIR